MAGKQQYTATQVADAITASKGMLTIAARALGCAYMTVRNYIDRYPTVKQAYELAHENLGDQVELTLYDEAINKRNTAALIFLAKTRFKERGFVERQEVQIEDWRSQAIADIRAGNITYEALKATFDYDLATQLFREAGVSIPAE